MRDPEAIPVRIDFQPPKGDIQAARVCLGVMVEHLTKLEREGQERPFHITFTPETMEILYQDKIFAELAKVENRASRVELEGAPLYSLDVHRALEARHGVRVGYLAGMLSKAWLTDGANIAEVRVKLRAKMASSQMFVGADFRGVEPAFADVATLEAAFTAAREELILYSKQHGGIPMTLRVHVGEGAMPSGGRRGDPETRDIVRQASDNISRTLEVLEKMEGDRRANSTSEAEIVTFRLGHVAALTYDQALIICKLGVGVELNPSSNIATGIARGAQDSPIINLVVAYHVLSKEREKALSTGLTGSAMPPEPRLLLSVNTDGNGVMHTTLEKELEIVRGTVRNFREARKSRTPSAGVEAGLYALDYEGREAIINLLEAHGQVERARILSEKNAAPSTGSSVRVGASALADIPDLSSALASGSQGTVAKGLEKQIESMSQPEAVDETTES